MIPLGCILLDPKCIFVNVSSCEISLICLPAVERLAQAPNLREFFREIMFSVQFDQNENCGYISKIINHLNAAQNFSISEFHRILCEMVPDEGRKQTLYSSAESQKGLDKRRKVIGHVEELGGRPTPQSEPQSASAPTPAPVPTPPPMPTPKPTPPISTAPAPDSSPKSAEKSISLFYLLQHYNKENAAIYKAQKEQKKKRGQTDQALGKDRKETKEKKKSKKGAQPSYQPPSFAIPGQTPSAQISFPTPANMPPAQAEPAPRPQPQPAVVSAPSAPAPANGDFGDTTFAATPDEMTEDNETVILGQERPSQQMVPHLVRKRNQERIIISKDVFRIGRDTGFNDYVIADNKYIGHSHCYILSRDGEFFIVDSNSKNHTTVDGVVIPSGQQVKLTHGCTILVADEEFEFRLF